MSNKYNKKNDYIFTIVFSLITVLVIGYAVADREMVEQVVRVAQWKVFALAAVSALVAYSAMSLSVVFMNKLFSIKVARPYQFMVNFVTLSIGNLMDFGGAIGYSLRAALYKARGGDISDSISSSVYHSYYMFLMLLLTLPIGIYGIYSMNMVNDQNRNVFALAVVVSFVGSVTAAMFIFVKKIRLKVLGVLSAVIKAVTKKNVRPALDDFCAGMDKGIENTKKNPKQFVISMILVGVYWFFSMLVLWLCFYSLGVKLNPFVLVTGFAVGITITTFSFIPGGIGIQEASTAGVISLLGVDFHLCVLVTFIFRVIYYLFTTFISLIIYWVVLRPKIDDKGN